MGKETELRAWGLGPGEAFRDQRWKDQVGANRVTPGPSEPSCWRAINFECFMSSTSHRDLRVWQVAIEIASDCFAMVKQFPRDELFGLTSQIRRAAASVPANIAEGYGRYSKNETIRFLNIANGSLIELDTHLELARRAGYLTDAEALPFTNRIRALGAMIFAFKTAVRRPPQAPGPRPVVPTSATTAP